MPYGDYLPDEMNEIYRHRDPKQDLSSNEKREDHGYPEEQAAYRCGVACKKDGYAKKKDDEYDRDVRVVQKRRRYRGVQESEHARNRVGAHDIKTLRLPRGYIHTASSFREQKSDGIEM